MRPDSASIFGRTELHVATLAQTLPGSGGYYAVDCRTDICAAWDGATVTVAT